MKVTGIKKKRQQEYIEVEEDNGHRRSRQPKIKIRIRDIENESAARPRVPQSQPWYEQQQPYSPSVESCPSSAKTAVYDRDTSFKPARSSRPIETQHSRHAFDEIIQEEEPARGRSVQPRPRTQSAEYRSQEPRYERVLYAQPGRESPPHREQPRREFIYKDIYAQTRKEAPLQSADRRRHERSISSEKSIARELTRDLPFHPLPIRPDKDDERVVIKERWIYRPRKLSDVPEEDVPSRRAVAVAEPIREEYYQDGLELHRAQEGVISSWTDRHLRERPSEARWKNESLSGSPPNEGSRGGDTSAETVRVHVRARDLHEQIQPPRSHSSQTTSPERRQYREGQRVREIVYNKVQADCS